VRRDAAPTKLLLLLFAVSFTAYLVCGPMFLVYDGDIMYRVSESLLWRHSLRIEDPMLHLNEPYATYGVAVSVLLLPLVATGQLLFHDGGRLTSLFQPAVTAATVVVVALVAREIRCSWRTSLGVALLYGFGTLAWVYSNILFSEPLVALATVVAVLGLLRFRHEGSHRWLAATGGAVALAVLGRTDSVVVTMLPLSGFALVAVLRASPSWRVRVRALAAYGLPVAAAILIVLGYDWIRYGSGLRTGYLVPGAGFTFPFVWGFLGLLASPGAGLFVFTPVLTLAVLGFPGFVRRHASAASLVGCLVGARLLFYASWWGWDGGDSWGPRFLVPVLPLLILPLVFVPRRVALRPAISVLAAISIAIEVLGQLVSYYTFALLAVVKLPPGSSLPACLNCGMSSALAIQGVKDKVDFDWGDAPLLYQLRVLVQHGPVHRGLNVIVVTVILLALLGISAPVARRLLRSIAVHAKEAIASGPAPAQAA
jgi:hypothetical protein